MDNPKCSGAARGFMTPRPCVLVYIVLFAWHGHTLIFRCIFGWFLFSLGSILLPNLLPKTSKIHEKSMPRGIPSWPSIFDWFLIDFPSILQPLELSKSWFFQRKNKVFSKTRLSQFTSIFHSILMPTCFHFPSQNRPTSHKKSILTGIYFLMYFSIDFFSLLAQFWKPTWLNLAPKTRQDGARNRPGGTQNRGKTLLGSENGPELDFRSIWDGFWMVFWWILDGFGMDFCWIFDRFGMKLG